jgi:drug/metabolite transporter (DMT)-like permease
MKRPGRLTIALVFIVLCMIWGSTWAVIQIGLEGVPPFSGVSIRFVIAALVMLALIFLMRIGIGTSRRERRLWVINGVFSFALSYGVVYWSEQWVPSGLAAVLFATYPLFVAIVAHFMLPAETLTRPEAWGILAGFLGVGVIFSEDFAALGGEGVAVAAAVMLLSPCAAAISSVAVKRWGGGIHPFSLAAVPMAIGAGITGVIALLTERGHAFSWDTRSVSALLYLAIMGSAVTFTLYYWLLSHLPAKRMALIAYIIPVEAVVIGAFRDEPITLRVVLGATLVVAGVAMAVHRGGGVKGEEALAKGTT